MKHAIKVLTVFPLIIFGYIIGFLATSIVVGFCAGKHDVEKLGEECAEKIKK